MFNVFCASQKCLCFIKNKISILLWFLRLFYVLFQVFCRLIEVNWHFNLKMDSDICDDFMSPT
jgi:hypothetical protein